MRVPPFINRGPIFRALKKFERISEARRHRKWIREKNRDCCLSKDLMLTGNDRFPLEALEIEAGVEIQRFSYIWINPETSKRPRLKIGKRVFMGQGCIVSCSEDLTIGDDTLIGAYTYLLTNDHRFSERERRISEQGYSCAPLVIGRDVWIGAHSVIRKGVTVGEGAVVGACSLVTKDIPSFEIWGGVPARKLGER